jgi:hypothetical protein
LAASTSRASDASANLFAAAFTLLLGARYARAAGLVVRGTSGNNLVFWLFARALFGMASCGWLSSRRR